MNRETAREKLLDLIEDRLPRAERQQVEQHLASDHELFREFDQLRQIDHSLGNSPQLPAPGSISANFYQALEEETQRQKTENTLGGAGRWVHLARRQLQSNNWLKLAAAAVIFIAGFITDKQIQIEQLQTSEMQKLQKEITATKSLVMLSLLQQRSASDRIKAVNYTYEMEEINAEVAEALIYTINNDPSSNVRLAACEALSQYTGVEKVKQALVATISQQTDPALQIFLVDLMVAMEEKSAVPEMQKLLQEQELIDIVQGKIYEGMDKLM